ncbi:16196_t:CDS:2, partial [Cetraspora pellucida]
QLTVENTYNQAKQDYQLCKTLMEDDLFYTNVLKKIKNYRGYLVDSVLRGVEFNFETEMYISKQINPIKDYFNCYQVTGSKKESYKSFEECAKREAREESDIDVVKVFYIDIHKGFRLFPDKNHFISKKKGKTFENLLLYLLRNKYIVANFTQTKYVIDSIFYSIGDRNIDIFEKYKSINYVLQAKYKEKKYYVGPGDIQVFVRTLLEQPEDVVEKIKLAESKKELVKLRQDSCILEELHIEDLDFTASELELIELFEMKFSNSVHIRNYLSYKHNSFDSSDFDHVIYVKYNVKTMIERQREHNREDEKCTEEYLKHIYNEYEKLINNMYSNYIVFDSSKSLK